MAQVILAGIALCIFSGVVVHGFKDGDLYKITNVGDGNALSVNSSGSGYTLTTEPWADGANQKWLAVEAIVATDAYLMLPQRQSWDWAKFSGAGTKDKRDQLPDNTMVAAFDSTKHQVIQESYGASRKAQQWQSVSMGHDKFLIKNLADEKCLVNLGELKPKKSFLEKTKHKLQKIGHKKKGDKKSKPGFVDLLTCVSTEDKHLWRLEVLPNAAAKV